MLKKTTFLIFAFISLALGAFAANKGEWRLFNTFDDYVRQVIDTRDKTYALVLGQYYNYKEDDQYNLPHGTLFMYDKATDELVSLNRLNKLSETIIHDIFYNRDKGYLMIVYENGNIDFLYDDGTVRNIPGLKSFATSSPKTIYDVTFDAPNDRVYVAADFGYMILDDKKFEITESLLTTSPVRCVGRAGNRMIVASDAGVFTYPVGKYMQSLNDMQPFEDLSNITKIMPLDNGLTGVIADLENSNGGVSPYLYTLRMGDDGKISDLKKLHHASVMSGAESRDGYYLSIYNICLLLRKDGSFTVIRTPTDDSKKPTASWDFREFWYLSGRQGLESRRYSEEDGWAVTRSYMHPDAPNVFRAQFMDYSDKYGFLVVNHGSNRVFKDMMRRIPNLLSAYNDGRWEHYGMPYRNPEYSDAHTYPRGLAIDPNDPDKVYFAALEDGIMRINLADPNDIMRFGNQSTRLQNLPVFYNEFPGTGVAAAMAPKFDASGTLWTFSYGTDTNARKVWAWPAQSRVKGDVSGIIKISVPGIGDNAHGDVYPCKSSRNKNLVIFWPGNTKDKITVLDHKGTLSDTSDDNVIALSTLYDQDGGIIAPRIVYDMWEDPSSGTVWVAEADGIFTFNPRDVFSNPNSARRIKVSRNDGTSLADYLLAGSLVYKIATDPSGDKWFATSGGGLVHTSADGTRVIEQFTADNSFLPDDNVYSVQYNPQNHSMFVSTEKGLAEYILPGGGSAGKSDSSSVHIYPNPVRPDYYGWINIEGLADNSLVKIVDSAGNLVREVGRAEGGSIQWDGLNHSGKRVRSGVYIVLSSSAGDSSETNVGKIVVVN